MIPKDEFHVIVVVEPTNIHDDDDDDNDDDDDDDIYDIFISIKNILINHSLFIVISQVYEKNQMMFTISRDKISRGILSYKRIKENGKRKIEHRNNKDKSLSTKIQSYHKSWKRKNKSKKYKNDNNDSLLYRHYNPYEKKKETILVETTLISEYNVSVFVNDDLTTSEILTERQQIIISNSLSFKCPVCLEIKQVYFIQLCGHCLCQSCLTGLIEIANDNSIDHCTVCRRRNDDDGYYQEPF